MRIRQLRPEFFTDPVTGRLPAPVQVTYIGLWCIADDAGWLDWDVEQIGALLYPYRSVRVRTKNVSDSASELQKVGRLVLYECGCARIPTLESHQRIGGNKSYQSRDKHSTHKRAQSIPVWTSPPVTLGNGSNGTAAVPSGPAAADFNERMAAADIKPEIVGKAS